MATIILKKNLFNEVLLNPAKEFDKLCIVSGFATPSMVTYHLGAIKDVLDRNDTMINLIVGMAPLTKISRTHHKNFMKLMAQDMEGTFECSYTCINHRPIHSKLYTWLKGGKPQIAFLTSANYTFAAFKGNQDEIAAECDADRAFAYYRSVIDSSLYCTHDEAEDLVSNDIGANFGRRGEIHDSSDGGQIMTMEDENSVKLPLYDVARNEVQKTAGLNWGQRKGRNPNQAYIHIPADIAKSDFFPPIGVPFSVLTEDGIPFVCVRAQPKVKGGKIGYAIETPNNNSELGEYFRRKLGLRPGVFVRLDDLDRYGNRYATFTKISDEEYYMRFPASQG